MQDPLCFEACLRTVRGIVGVEDVDGFGSPLILWEFILALIPFWEGRS